MRSFDLYILDADNKFGWLEYCTGSELSHSAWNRHLWFCVTNDVKLMWRKISSAFVGHEKFDQSRIKNLISSPNYEYSIKLQKIKFASYIWVVIGRVTKYSAVGTRLCHQ